MKQHFNLLSFSILLLLLLTGCSTSRNTWLTRDADVFATRYNVYFNASQSFQEGIDKINDAQKDNYTQLIPLFPISIHENAKAGSSDMDITIQKCRKAIKQHSVKVKPKRNYEKVRDPAYIAFMNQEEYNPIVIQSWLLLANAEFYKADFMNALGTYTYIATHFGQNSEVMNETRIGKARCFLEMGWLYEAEDALNKVSGIDVNSKNNGLYAAIKTDLLIREKKFAEAIPFLSLAIEHTGNGYLKRRFLFLSGQLEQQCNDYPSAYRAFTKVIHSNPPYEMEFAARLLRAQSADQGEQQKEIDELNSMLRSPKNSSYLNQIYIALGTIYSNDNEKEKAINCYREAIRHTDANSYDQAEAYVKLGDLYFTQKEYFKAQPDYDAAAKLIKQEDENFDRVRTRSVILNQLATYHTDIELQDSLQHLAQLPDKEKMEVINNIIEQQKNAKIKEAKDATDAKRQTEITSARGGFLSDGGATSFSTSSMNNNSKSWYFYNSMAVSAGKSQFQTQWGDRTLSDNWRQSSKTDMAVKLSVAAPSSSSDSTQQTVVMKNTPAFYLAQLPLTTKAVHASNQQIGNDLLHIGFIYEMSLSDQSMAIKTYEELFRRFSADSLWIDGYYALYLLYAQRGDSTKALQCKSFIIHNFKDTKYGLQLMHPEYVQEQTQANAQEDSLYETTFKAYLDGDFSTVMNNMTLAKKEYPFSNLMPKFDLLNAISLGKTGDMESMKTELYQLIKAYPNSDVCPTAKNIIALLDQGKIVPKGGSFRNTFAQLTKTTITNVDTLTASFSLADDGRELVLFTVPSDSLNINQLLYKIAAFNFDHFVLQDFDLEIRRQGVNMRFLIISDFNNFNEAIHYEQLVHDDDILKDIVKEFHTQTWVISDDNLKKLLIKGNLTDYIQFYETKLIPKYSTTNNSSSKSSINP
jgi:tetratricopeptide (TPR) repeat protein